MLRSSLFTAMLLLQFSTTNAATPTAGSQAPTEAYANVNGLKMYYEIHGRGEGVPLVLLHGGGSTIHTTFGNILPLLAAHRKIIALELQGHGHTADRETALSFEQDADDVAALLHSLNIDKADVFGFSNGGNAGIQLAIRHPQLVRKLVAGSVFYKKAGLMPGLEEMFRKATADNMPPAFRKAYEEASPHPQRLGLLVSKLMARLLGFKDWSPETLKAIHIPVLLMAGNHDVATMEHTVELYHLFPKGQLVILPGGHGSYIGEVTAVVSNSRMHERTVALIEEFLDQP